MYRAKTTNWIINIMLGNMEKFEPSNRLKKLHVN